MRPRLLYKLAASLLMTGIVLAVGWRAGMDVASAAATYPRGNIDNPPNAASVSGGVTVSGWAVDLAATTNTGIDKVQIFVDGAYSGDAVYGRSRADVAAGFHKPWLTNSGFLFMLDSSTVGGGTHTLEARAHSTISGAVTAYAHTLVVTGSPPATPRPTATSTPTPLPGTATPTQTPKPTATPVPPSNFPKQFGINTHLTWYDAPRANIDLQRAQSAGLQSVRFDIQWDKLEPSNKNGWNGVYLSQVDQALAATASHRLQPLVVLIDTPAWARSNVGSSASPPTNVQDYADTLGFLAARYASQSGLAYEIWNEPNQIAFWDSPGGPNALIYSNMLKAAYTSIKASAPNAIVVGGSIAFNDQTFLQGMYAFGGVSGYYDVISLHPYSLTFAPESAGDGYHSFEGAVTQTIQTMAQYNQQNKAIWITEMNWAVPDVTEDVRAAYLRRAVELVRTWPQVAQFMPYLEDQADGDLPMGLMSTAENPSSSWMGYSLEVSVPNSGASHVLGVMDSPVEAAIVYGSVQVSGWAADLGSASGSGVDSAKVYLDGVYVADATYGSARTDIGSVYGSRFTNSGYIYQLNLASVPLGNHTVEIRAHSTITGAATSYLRPINLLATPTHPAGSLDSPAAGSTAATTLRVSGWAVDAAAIGSSGVDRVQVFLDTTYIADAVLGQSRADIGVGFGPQFANSGFVYQLSLAGVPAGLHTVKASARSFLTGVETIYANAFSVTIPSYPSGNMDSLTNGATISGTVSISGWAIDSGAATGTGVDQVQVYVDGALIGDATYGQSRADIGSVMGSRYADSGYVFSLGSTGLTNGAHTVEARARSTVTGTGTSYSHSVVVAN